MVAKDQACLHRDKACHGDACPLARGFYDRLPGARDAAVADGWMDEAALRRIALEHHVCPYYLGQELLRWADVVVGDVHHLFDSNGQLWSLTQAEEWRLSVLVDEAHNLIDRVRRMYSAELQLGLLRVAMTLAPLPMRGRFDVLLHEAQTLTEAHVHAEGQAVDCAVVDAVPEPLISALRALNAALGEHFQHHPTAVGALLNAYFQLLRFERLVDTFGEHSLFQVQRMEGQPDAPASGTETWLGDDAEGISSRARALTGHNGPTAGTASACDVALAIRNVVPARFMRLRLKGVHTVTLLSATLGPPRYQCDLLGLPEDTDWIDVPSFFLAENFVVRTAAHLSTRLPHRQKTLRALTDVIAGQFDAQPGNYLAFFSSFAYLDQVADSLRARRPDIAQWRQGKGMDGAARLEFLQRFIPEGVGIGFAVLGGVFAEGVDLPGTRLIGAFIATLGLPPVSATQDQTRARLDKLFGQGNGYADLVPAMQKVVQAAGRVVRSPEDRGWLWLLDDRYERDEVIALLPQSWGLDRQAPAQGAVCLRARSSAKGRSQPSVALRLA